MSEHTFGTLCVFFGCLYFGCTLDVCVHVVLGDVSYLGYVCVCVCVCDVVVSWMCVWLCLGCVHCVCVCVREREGYSFHQNLCSLYAWGNTAV